MINPPLTDKDYLQQVLAKHRVTPAKSLGQNFLISGEVVEATLAVLEEGPRNITELGPGIGALTQGLLASGFSVKAIEKDDDFVRMIPDLMPAKKRDQLELIHNDLKDVDWSWPEPYQLVGNIPYNLSGLILRRLTQLDHPPTQAILLVQKEVGQRMRTVAPDLNLLALAVSLWGNAQNLLNVPPNCFWPQPKVYSQLILLTPTPDNPIKVTAREEILSIAKIFFQQKRKQMGGMLKKYFNLPDEQIVTILQQADLNPQSRPQEATKENWHKLVQALTPLRRPE